MNNNHFNSFNNPHQLIQRTQNYYLQRKLIAFHSEDRDAKKWPNANEFEIQLPEAMTNVQSIRLVEVEFPTNYYTFSNSNQNTKMIVDSNVKQITDGFYTPEQLMSELKHQLGITDVRYSQIEHKFIFGNTSSFSFDFQNLSGGVLDFSSNCSDKYTENAAKTYARSIHWGLGYNLGFGKEKYESTVGPYTLNYLDPAEYVPSVGSQYIKAPFKTSLYGDNAIYMEIEKYNQLDEVEPYIDSDYLHAGENDLSFCCSMNDSSQPRPAWQRKKLIPKNIKTNYNGKVDSAFAKIPFPHIPYSRNTQSKNGFLMAFSNWEVPIERIQKLKFKFRKHNGKLMDFKNDELHFTLEFNCLNDEIKKDFNVRIPDTYFI
jgi:hypothetical protein